MSYPVYTIPGWEGCGDSRERWALVERVLVDLVRDGTFRASRDGALIGSGDDLEWAAFGHLQQVYRDVDDDAMRLEIALDFQRLVRQAHEEAARKSPAARRPIKSVNLRLSGAMHEELKESSAKAGRSLQREIIWLLEEALALPPRG